VPKDRISTLDWPNPGHCLIVREIGAGGLGVVCRAHNEQLDRDVALKVHPAGLLADEAARKRFRNEALALTKLNQPDIKAVHDFGSERDLDSLVMELIHGVPLSQKIRDGPLHEMPGCRPKPLAWVAAAVSSKRGWRWPRSGGSREKGWRHANALPPSKRMTRRRDSCWLPGSRSSPRGTKSGRRLVWLAMISGFQRSLDAVTIHAQLTGSSAPKLCREYPIDFCS
jgi:hypothetical protein